MAKRGRPRNAVTFLSEISVKSKLKNKRWCLRYCKRIDGKQHESSSVGMSPSSWATEEESKQHAAAFLAKLSQLLQLARIVRTWLVCADGLRC